MSTFKVKYDPGRGLVQESGATGVEINDAKVKIKGTNAGAIDVTRNITARVSPLAGTPEYSGSLLQLKNKFGRPSINFHIGGNQYMTQNSWFDSSTNDWIHEATHAAFGIEFKRVHGVFAIVHAPVGNAGSAVNGNGVFSTALSVTGSSGAIAVGKKVENGCSATFDITGSNKIALAVTGSVDIGGGKPDAALILPSHNTAARDNIPNPRAGMLIFNSQTGKLNFYTGATWEAVTSA